MMQSRDFSKTGDAIALPNVVELQIVAYGRFLQRDRLPEERRPVGLEGLFREVFPLTGVGGRLTAEYLDYELDAPLSFDVLVHEVRGLGLNMRLERAAGAVRPASSHAGTGDLS